MKLLIVDDDRNICSLLELYLKNEGYELLFAHDGSTAITMVHEMKPDLVLLDIMLPVINGREVCRIIRTESDVPVIMVTSMDLLDDKITGLDAGADDYIVKPFEPKEVVARVKARLRTQTNNMARNSDISQPGIAKTNASHSGVQHTGTPRVEAAYAGITQSGTSDAGGSNAEGSHHATTTNAGGSHLGVFQPGMLKTGSLSVDINKYEVCIDDQIIELKPKEIQLLYFLLNNRNIVFTREQLLEKVWDYSFMGDTRTVDVHIKRLREKLDAPAVTNKRKQSIIDTKLNSWKIVTVWGVGYKFEVRNFV